MRPLFRGQLHGKSGGAHPTGHCSGPCFQYIQRTFPVLSLPFQLWTKPALLAQLKWRRICLSDSAAAYSRGPDQAGSFEYKAKARAADLARRTQRYYLKFNLLRSALYYAPTDDGMDDGAP